MVKYATIILGVLLCLCCVLTYRLGDSNCRKAITESKNQIQQTHQRRHETIKQVVLSSPDDVNLQWLLETYRRGD